MRIRCCQVKDLQLGPLQSSRGLRISEKHADTFCCLDFSELAGLANGLSFSLEAFLEERCTSTDVRRE